MISHFIIIIDGSGRSAQVDSVERLSKAFSAPNVTVFTNSPVIKLADRGCILGHLFTRSIPSRRLHTLDDASIDKIVRSEGRSLLTDYWGGYIALILNQDGGHTVLRDPSGIMPCYWHRNAGQIALSNDIASVSRSIDYDHVVDLFSIAQFLASPVPPWGETGLFGVHELMPGEALIDVPSHSSTEQWWSPWDFVTPKYNVPIADATAHLRNVVADSIGRWASCFNNILLGVSGGLDSSIVAAVAAFAGSDIRCLNMYADDPEGDERHYAKVLADALSLPLITQNFSLSDINVNRAPLPFRPWPNASYFTHATQVAHQRINTDRTIDAYFSGNGGDNVFCSIRSTAPFLDRFLIEGPGLGLKDTLRDLCDLTETAAPTVLKIAWRNYRQLSKPRPNSMNYHGLSTDIAQQVAKGRKNHPWLNAPTDSLPGRYAHIAQLARAYQSHELYPRSRNQPHIAPLLSQPIIETCLAIPSWHWIAGGVNRAVARNAFSHLLPHPLIRRVSKGGPTGFLLSVYHENQQAIKGMLRNGVLAQQGFLDTDYIDRQIDPTWRGHDKILRLLDLAVAETWCKAWSNPRGK